MGGSSGIVNSAHWRGLRLLLRDARLSQKISAVKVGQMIGQYLRDAGDPDATDVNENTVYAWEKFERHPSIANMAAWAAVLDYRLLIDLDSSQANLETEEAAQVARLMDRLPEHLRVAILRIARGLAGIEDENG